MNDPLAALDGYELRHLGSHQVAANRFAELHGLLGLETDPEATPHGARRQNAWYAAHLRLEDVSIFIQDVRRAWAAAEEQLAVEIAEGQHPSPLCVLARYAIIDASLQSIITALPARLRAELVRHGIWSVRRAVVEARRLAEPEALARLVPFSSGVERTLHHAGVTFFQPSGRRCASWARSREQ
jgi:hypothetical protein